MPRSRVLVLAAVLAWYAAATLPYLGDFPPPTDWGEMEIAATAYRLASTGVYGNEMYAGFYGAEDRYYVFMPMQPVLMAASLKLLGLGIVQARLVSVAWGASVLALTFLLGRRLASPAVGLVAAAALAIAPLAVEVRGTGVPLLDLARSMRFDILVPVFVLGACLAFARAEASGSRRAFLATGVLLGLASLSHVWGAFPLPLLLALLFWRSGVRAGPGAAILILGFLLALLPWVAFVSLDPGAFLGQMCRHAGRFEFTDPAFYLSNLRREPARYARFVGGSFRHPELWPRVGLLATAAAVLVGNAVLVSRLRRDRRLGDALLLAAPPVLGLMLGLLVSTKRYPYTLLVLPFLALQAGVGVVRTWERTSESGTARALLALLLVVAGAEGVAGVARALAEARATTPYATVSASLARLVPAGARVLAPQPYWIALQGRSVRSSVLPTLLADPTCYAKPLSMDDALGRVQPDYVIEEDRFVDYRNPENPRIEGLLRPFERALRARCPTPAGRLELPGYDPATVYRCDSTAR